MKKIANTIEKVRRKVHQLAENRLISAIIAAVFYGGLTLSVVGIIVVVAAWIISDE